MKWADLSNTDQSRYIRYWGTRRPVASWAVWREHISPRMYHLKMKAFTDAHGIPRGWPVGTSGTPCIYGGNGFVKKYDHYYMARFPWRWWTEASTDMMMRRGFGARYAPS